MPGQSTEKTKNEPETGVLRREKDFAVHALSRAWSSRSHTSSRSRAVRNSISRDPLCTLVTLI